MKLAKKWRTGWGCAAVAALLLGALTPAPPSLATSPESRLQRARERLLELEKDFELVVERYNAASQDLAAIEGRMAALQLELTRLNERIETERGAAVGLARELYKGGPASGLEAVLSADSFAEADERLTYLRSSEVARAQVFERLGALRDLEEQKLQRLEETRARARAGRNRLASLRSAVESKLVRQKDEIARLNAVVERAERLRALRAQRARAAARRAEAAATPGSSTPAPEPATGALPAPAPNPQAEAAVRAALSQVGKPYQWGAAGPDSYDCSGLTMWAWARAGVSLPHNSGQQYAATPRVSRSDWAPGDLLFFGDPIHHVGMYIGDGRMVEAPYTGSRVRTNSASRPDYVGAGRPGV